MEKLAKAIDDLSEQAASIPGKPFVERVVQIKFNAWHYADANLWASITAEFFDQLRAGGYHEGAGGLSQVSSLRSLVESQRPRQLSPGAICA